MQILFIIFSLLCFWTNTLFSDTIAKEPIKVELLIKQIKSAKPQERRVLMNHLKLRLRTMNQGSRAKAMMRLRKSFAKGYHQGIGQQHKGSMMRQEKVNTPQHTPQRNTHKGMQQGQHRGKR